MKNSDFISNSGDTNFKSNNTKEKTQKWKNKMENTTKIEQMREKNKIKKKQIKKIEAGKLGLNQILKPLLFFIISLALEIVSFSLFKFKTSSGQTAFLPQYILFDIGVWLIVCSLILCTHKNWISNLIFYVALFLEAGLFVTNVTLKSDFGYVFSIDMLDLVPEMVESMDTSFINFKLITFGVIGATIVIAIPIVFDKIFKNKKIALKKISRPIFCLLFFLVTATIGAGCYAAQTALLKTSATNTEISSDKYLYENQHINDLSFQKFGSCGFYFKSIVNYIFPNAGVSKQDKTEAINSYKESAKAENTSATLYNDNLIVIMLESFEWFAIDPYNTPNLWALKSGEASENIDSQAMVFSNYHSNNKTNVSEDLCFLGYMPNENTYNVKSNNSLATYYSLPNLFNREGYDTTFLHSWKLKFYNRGVTNKNIGFNNIYSLSDFESENKSTRFNFYNLESDFIDQFMDKLAPTDKKFMSFYLTVSTHGTYTVTNPQFEKYFSTYDNNLENMKTWFEDQGYHYPTSKEYQEILKEYKAGAMDTDEMVGKLFKHLNETGLINNTTVVLYADHNAFYQNLTNEIKSTVKSDYSSSNSYVVPLMIYSNKLTASNITAFCSPYDLYPTISELFGLPYNTVNAQGKNILSSEISETVYISMLTGFYDDKCYSKNMQYIKKYDGSTDADVENFKNKVCEYFKKQRTLSIVYKSNETVV